MNNKEFVKELARYKGRNVFNPYSDICEVYDKCNANKIRSKNLEVILNALSKNSLDAIWIGRDLGHRGGRRTGIALTDEGNLRSASETWGVEIKQATTGNLFYERTAASIWDIVNRIDSNILMWNVFPFHPHEVDKQLSNRSHTAKERDHGLEVLISLIAMVRPNMIVAIGNDAYKSAVRVFDPTKVSKVRHPSYGGEKKFSAQLRGLYEVDDSKDSLF